MFSNIALLDLPTGVCCSWIPIFGRMFLPRIFARLSSTTISKVVLRVHPPDSIGATTHPNDGILYPL